MDGRDASPALIPVRDPRDVPARYRDTPIARLLGFHNLRADSVRVHRAELLVGMCMDHRKRLRIPENFAYIMRTGGADLRRLEFQVAYAVAVGGVRAMAVIGHDRCGMSGLEARREEFVTGLVEGAGWDRETAERLFHESAPDFEIGDPARAALEQVRHWRRRFPALTVAPLFYLLDDGLLYLIEEEGEREA